MSDFTTMPHVAVMASAWLTFGAWVIGEVALVRQSGPLQPWRRLIWTVGALALAVHWLVAFGFVHAWSHEAAFEATAHQTRERVGVDWGGGVFANYVLIAWWLGDAAAAWLRLRHWNVPGMYRSFRRGSFWFMWFNAAVVFASGFRRVPAAALCLMVLVLWIVDWRATREVKDARGRPANSV